MQLWCNPFAAAIHHPPVAHVHRWEILLIPAADAGGVPAARTLHRLVGLDAGGVQADGPWRRVRPVAGRQRRAASRGVRCAASTGRG